MTDTGTDKPQDPIDPVDRKSKAAGAAMTDMSLDEALSADAKKGDRRKKSSDKEKAFIKYGMSGMSVLLLIMMVYSCQPTKGSMSYGICSTFLELNVPYPHTLRYIALEGSRTSMRIYFTNVDAFGEFKQEMIECKYGPDPDHGMRLTEILRNRKQVDSKIVSDFNKTLPIIMASDPYRITPPDWKNQLLGD